MKIALLGFGTVGYGVYDILQSKQGITVEYVLDLKTHEDITAKSVTDISIILADNEVDTVVELIGGYHPAYEFITASLKAGKNVITANKYVICEHYAELTELANKSGVSLRYTAAVGGGIQWLVNLERMIGCEEPNKICGIMNGTTNYILDSMHNDSSDFDNALKNAQELGYAEADPSADIDGLDALRKIVISANIAFSADISPSSASVLGIGSIYSDDIKAAECIGCVCRLLTNAIKTDTGIAVFVEPTFVSKTDIFASVEKNLNYILVESPLAGKSGFFGFGAGRYPTAYTVVNDCIDIKKGVKAPYNTVANKMDLKNNSHFSKYYIRTAISDDAWLNSVKESDLCSGIITKNVSVSELHSNVKRLSCSDPGCFAAAIRKDV